MLPKLWHASVILGVMLVASFALSWITGNSAPWVFAMVIGGLIYTAGVFVFISPKVKFRRAIWHGFVVTGAMTHWAAVLVGVVLAPAALG